MVPSSADFPCEICKQQKSIAEAQGSCRRERWSQFRDRRVKKVVESFSHSGNSYCEQVNGISDLARCLSEGGKTTRGGA